MMQIRYKRDEKKDTNRMKKDEKDAKRTQKRCE
jgi:hypothetical protein